ncbi:MAG: hypothetical protein KGL34_03375 [Gammaproteobacteria bacterium]|nr:hypothetical protein [Gammaproteobacteria bacterium]
MRQSIHLALSGQSPHAIECGISPVSEYLISLLAGACCMQCQRCRSPGIRRLGLISLLLLIVSAHPATASLSTAPFSTHEIDRSVIASLPTWHGKSGNIIDHLDLSRPFATQTQWTFVVATLPGSFADVFGDTIDHGTLAVCFVEKLNPHCEYARPNATPSSWLSTADGLSSAEVVFVSAGHADPLLLLKTTSQGGANGNHFIYTQAYMFDRTDNQFKAIFSNKTASNNNQQTRFIEDGPLRGDIIVDEPTGSAPFDYWISVYTWSRGKPYSLALRYRSDTHYGDGNPLAVIDSEMRNILMRLRQWKAGDPLPIPPHSTCKPYLRGGEEWCR